MALAVRLVVVVGGAERQEIDVGVGDEEDLAVAQLDLEQRIAPAHPLEVVLALDDAAEDAAVGKVAAAARVKLDREVELFELDGLVIHGIVETRQHQHVAGGKRVAG